ncbi:MAG: hypothetical protein A3F40_02935 [Chlamydiae bacterium RIFCSPHIGHO2_12_FULL_27_8]|nr:MAG: hypothetical protein A3F40_02935 [Chlamydiae bacterium RIFCSPHIGHO2_12_FULL_27_8]
MKILVNMYILFSLFFLSCDKKIYKNNSLRTVIYSDLSSLDPRKCGDYTSSQVMFLIYSGLLKISKENKPVLNLASSYTISKDKKTYIFYLKDSFWSDGKKLTAYDFEYTFQSMMEKSFPCMSAQLYYPIKNSRKIKLGLLPKEDLGVSAKDENTLIFTLENPCPYFLSLLSYYPSFPVPKHINEKNQIYTDERIVSNGPYLIEKWKKNNEIIFKKNQNYLNKDKVKTDFIHIKIVNSEETAFLLYENNEIDFLSNFLSPVSVDTLGNIKDRKDILIKSVGGYSFITFNLDSFPFNNINIRKAFSYAIDRKKLIENISQLNEKEAHSCIPSEFYKEDENEKNVLFNIEKAKNHLKDGLQELSIKKEDLNIKFLYGSYIIHKKEAEALKQMFKDALDIDIEIVKIEERTLFSILKNNKYQIALTKLIAQYNDPINILERFKFKNGLKNYPRWENNDFVRYLDTAEAEKNEKSRFSILKKAEKLLIDETVITPLYFYNYVLLKKSYVKGLYLSDICSIILEEAYLD